MEGGRRQENYPAGMRDFLLYAVIRLGLWALIWWVLTLVDVGVMLAGVLAAFLAMLISILFLDRLRQGAAMRWKAADERRAQRRGADVDEDAEYEDSLLDDAAKDSDSEDSVEEDAAADDDATEDAAAEDSVGPSQLPDLRAEDR